MVPMDKDSVKIYVPRFLLRWAHKFRVKLNPIYADENYDTDLVTDLPLTKLKKLMLSWGCELDHPNQFSYPDQVTSGHIYLKNGKQFHVRVSKHPDGLMMKGHVEWHGLTHPILHILYANLDYEKGYRMLKELVEKSSIKILIDKGLGKYNGDPKTKKPKNKKK